MSKLIATALVALAVAGSAAPASAGSIEVHGFKGTAYGTK